MKEKMTQYGFFFDQSRCTACHACTVACKSWNMLDPGPTKMARVFEWETGSYPDLTLHALFAPCYHCEKPVCVDAANGAIYKEEKYGAVLIDPANASGPALRAAWEACPYGSISFESDDPNAKAVKCTMCVDRLENSQLPACITACPMRALDFGPLEDLQKKYGTARDLEGMPDTQTTNPSVVFKPTSEKTQYVPYDPQKALPLLAQRGTLAPFFNNASDVTQDASNFTKRSKLVMKPRSVSEFMDLTSHDEG